MFVVRPRLCVLAGCLVSFLLLIPGSARGEEYYFVTVYGAQRAFNQPRYTHTWATLVRLTGQGTNLHGYHVETFTISWMPATLAIRPFKLLKDVGRNLTLEETLAWCRKNGVEITQFGPHQIVPELYILMQRRWDQLEQGNVGYRAGDLVNLGVNGELTNCIYAVLDFDRHTPTLRPATLGYGFMASAFIASRLRPWIVEPSKTYPFVSELVGVANYPAVRVGLTALVGNYPRVHAEP